MTEHNPIHLISEHLANGGQSIHCDLAIRITCPLCGKDIRGYVQCAHNIFQQVHFHSCTCSQSAQMCRLLEPLFRSASIDDLYDEAFVQRVTGQLFSFSQELRVAGSSFSDKILYAFYNKYFT
ncbi:hypothetical protein JI735_34055 (plasmid) [Paenibacillus sonchi]|uniref:Uncharacterized protein n=1 Tax=Paenibacillus sonchi TaxID=373687 RepID=A0A974PJK5_9BACL|nr:hypothetical protein [Paenibacillus sonchi]QQZ64671.1 hypothetical protein JI735_34055 [Paenibacillus sonchi]